MRQPTTMPAAPAAPAAPRGEPVARAATARRAATTDDHGTDGWPAVASGVAPADVAADAERAARRALRGQVAKLERDLGTVFAAGFGHGHLDVAVPAAGGGPRLLSLGELEALRDALADRLAGARAQTARRGAQEEERRALLEEMLREPARHPGARVSDRELGGTSCTVWEVRPRLGLIGMLAGWWHVKVSSGCPRPRARRAEERRAGSPVARAA